ncbi:GyrI-like domain-containing protein [Kibdelosporangium philippinense]|uniref:GyrI-like domain-containing protein n=1 Tax=Kibdelosporangium philippinense TaxID=211113 RepID=A0ABS8Z9D2_9PSEU|nr:GyrI-like domain-containing protein [Kibdelosporangium philippinense]MCE7004012.1 GyrI-like domain-containing protein [Kibdelosporangium philippinense]
MSIKPDIVQRAEQPYIGVRGTVTMDTFAKIADRIPELIGSLIQQGSQIAGAPFFRYTQIDMDHELEVEAGIPITAAVDIQGDQFTDVLPAGRYVSYTHIGHPDQLADITGQLVNWAAEQGLTLDNTGQRWGCRLEILKTNPTVEPDMTKWETELAIRLAD